ncbi:hypothetical protein [Maribacter sp. 2307UL18-2]|uniref:hypothetical protein n=1 Tax=Maribacter sp. 2307UL18-2 TaxID=3386274 RepID=UPI0039BC2F96
MKKVFLALMALVLNVSLISCTSDSIAENDSLYDTQATEGDDGDTDDDPDA